MDQMGVQSFQQLKQQTPVDRDPAKNRYVRCIVDPLIRAAGSKLDTQNWEVVVFQDETANAFALPGGKIGVHTGIFKVAKNDAQLAAVLGHEVGHVIAHHSNERVSQNMIAQLGLSVADMLSGNMTGQQKQLLMGGLGLGAQYGVLLPYSRSHESEADIIGLDLMSRAGFDPNQSVALWQNMKAASKGAPPEWMSTHPADETRIANLQARVPESLPKFNAARQSGNAPHCTL